MLDNSNVIKFERSLEKEDKRTSEMIKVPKVDLPFLKKTNECLISKEELLKLIQTMCSSGLYRMPKNLKTSADLIKFLKERPTFCLRARDYIESKEKDSRVAV